MDIKEQIKMLIDEIPASVTEKIGIAITTHNRYDTFLKSYQEIKRLAPKDAVIVVVDDASAKPVPEATFRFKENAGIAAAKNKCFELLYLAGCEHLFVFDDDIYPLKEDWHKPYVENREPHLNYVFIDWADTKKPRLNDTCEIYRDSNTVAYNHVRGCMLYYKRVVFEKVGGMDTVFGRWGWEHVNLSDRIYNAGLTSFRYMDVANSKGLFYSGDENSSVSSTVSGLERKEQIKRNDDIYYSKMFQSYYVPFIDKKNIYITAYLTGQPDPQRGKHMVSDLSCLHGLMNSVKDGKLVVLHDCFESPSYKNVEFVKVETSLNPYFQRWISIQEYLMQHIDEIDNVFCLDATDVEILRKPEWENLGENLWLGDEQEVVACEWMVKNHPNALLKEFIRVNGHRQLLNCGIVGGKAGLIKEFIRQMLDFYALEKGNAFRKKTLDAGQVDMGVFNYIAYTNFFDKIRTGRQVCTLFKANESNNISYFKHK